MIVKNKRTNCKIKCKMKLKLFKQKKKFKHLHIYIFFYEVNKKKVLFLKPLFFYSKFVKTKT